MIAKATIKSDDSSVTVRVPIAMKTRGCRKLVVSPDGNTSWPAPTRPRVDNTLHRAVVQAFHWKNKLESGQFATVSELALAERLNASYVAHVLRLTLLAPDLVEAILDGHPTSTMLLQRYIRSMPIEWANQRLSSNF